MLKQNILLSLLEKAVKTPDDLKADKGKQDKQHTLQHKILLHWSADYRALHLTMKKIHSVR
eukprot:4222733-Ditylum_brightwellii.AAC.1